MGIFRFLKIFWFFWKFSKTRPSMEHWAKIFFEKINPKHVQNTFGHFWERFWAFLDFWKFFDFFENFGRLDRPWNTGQNFFSGKTTPKHVQNTFGHFWERFWAFFDFWKFFDFFESFRRLDRPWNTGQKIFSKKLPQNMFKTRLDTFGNDFGHFWNFENFLIFFENFRRLDRPWNTGQIFFSKKKLPQNMFKTRLDTFGNDIGHFSIFENFLIFLKIFEDSTVHGTLGKIFFRKNYPKTCSKHVWTLLGTILGIFRFLKIFWFFWKFSKTRPSNWAKKFFEKITPKHVQNTFGHLWERLWAFFDFWKFFDFFENFRRLDRPWNTGQKFFSKKLTQNMFKTRLDTFGNDFGRFWIFENFLIFLKIFEDSTVHGTLGKNFFRKKYPKTCSKHVWTLLGTILGIFGFLKVFWFFWKFSKTRPSMEHWAKNFFRKNYPKTCSKHVWTLLGTILGIFGILKIFWFFLKIFEDSTVHGTLGKIFFSKKNYPKTCSKHVWTLLGTILGIFLFLKIFWFFWKFSKTRPSDWAKKFFEKIKPKHVQNTFGHLWERLWAFFDFWKFFDFFESFRRLDRPWNTGQKIFSKKLPQNMFKTRLDTFGNDFGHFWNFEKFFDFFENFRRLDRPWNTGQNFFSKKNYPKTCSKHVWTLLGTILGIFLFLKIFWFFWKFSKTRPSMEHWAKIFFEKITPKHVQNTFGHFWERFWAFFDFWKFFDFFENFRRLDPPTGQINFSKKLPQNMFKTRLDTFGNDYGHFSIFENFLIFLKIFEDSTVHGTLGKNFFRKN